jgi:hypothetical protein
MKEMIIGNKLSARVFGMSNDEENVLIESLFLR